MARENGREPVGFFVNSRYKTHNRTSRSSKCSVEEVAFLPYKNTALQCHVVLSMRSAVSLAIWFEWAIAWLHSNWFFTWCVAGVYINLWSSENGREPVGLFVNGRFISPHTKPITAQSDPLSVLLRRWPFCLIKTLPNNVMWFPNVVLSVRSAVSLAIWFEWAIAWLHSNWFFTWCVGAQCAC